jgi:hypothetical protein
VALESTVLSFDIAVLKEFELEVDDDVVDVDDDVVDVDDDVLDVDDNVLDVDDNVLDVDVLPVFSGSAAKSNQK